MEKIKAVIVENEKAAIENLEDMLQENCPIVELVGIFQTYKDALEGIQKVKPHLVFLDIGLDTKSGFELLKPLKHLYFEVIFTTISREHQIQAIRVEAVDYLSKPFTDDELVDAVNRAAIRIRKNMPQPKYLHVGGVREDLIVPFDKIMYCKADNNLTELHLFNEKSFVLSSDTLKKVEEELPSDQFYRIHRSHCVNRDYIKSINRNTGLAVEMKNGTKLEIAKDKKEDFYRWLGI